MAVTASVRRVRHKPLPKAIKGPRRVKVGFPAGQADSDVIARAFYNEFGTKGSGKPFMTKRGGGFGGPVPERPFMRNAMRNNRGKYRLELKSSAIKILRGETALATVLSKLGVIAQGDVEMEITTFSSPPNSPLTVKLKGSNKPLIDSGEMRGAVQYEVDG